MDWIKLDTGLFSDEKIQLLRCEKNGDELINIWLQLLCLAGKRDCEGVLMITEKKAYTVPQLAVVTGRLQRRLQNALEMFEAFGMVSLDNGCVTIVNWCKYHIDTERREAYKRNNAERQKRYRERQCVISNNASNNDSNTVTLRNKLRYITPEEEEEEEEEELQPPAVVENRNAAKRILDVWPNLPQTAIEQLVSYMADLPDEVIIWALEETQLKPGAGFKYMKTILERCVDQHLLTLEAVKQAEADHNKAYKNSQASTGSKSGNSGKADLNYQMHSYTENDFGDDFYYDPERDFKVQ